jgi:hypothetical protein
MLLYDTFVQRLNGLHESRICVEYFIRELRYIMMAHKQRYFMWFVRGHCQSAKQERKNRERDSFHSIPPYRNSSPTNAAELGKEFGQSIKVAFRMNWSSR